MELNIVIVENAIREGLAAKGNGVGYGCGRAYVCLDKVDVKTLNLYKRAAKNLGIRYLTEAYGSGKRVLYIGYDNSTGAVVAKAHAIAENLVKIGLPAYSDAVSD